MCHMHVWLKIKALKEDNGRQPIWEGDTSYLSGDTDNVIHLTNTVYGWQQGQKDIFYLYCMSHLMYSKVKTFGRNWSVAADLEICNNLM